MSAGGASWPRRVLVAVMVTVAAAALLAGCSRGPSPTGASQPSELFVVNTSPDQQRIRAESVREIADRVPEEIREGGKLIVATTGNAPPSSFRADDAMTMIGVEPDLAQLVADVLDLELELRTTDWSEVFTGVDEGRYHVGFANIAATPERMARFDMVTYQREDQAFAVLAGSATESLSRPDDIAGLRIGVGEGTRSEQILRSWNEELARRGLGQAELKHYVDGREYYAALESGAIDASFGPMSILNFEAVTMGRTKVVGRVPGLGTEPALVSAIADKGSGLGRTLQEALNAVIVTGKYQAVFERWALDHAVVARSQLNPPVD
ncbi:transporter substrate-binding domain-containing protein [Hoyosella sp. YIM 151337]|uniref:transporter substrate-binding domain-containing protein n=1 Tax=Hoyosella sp. YIM 151337 TaxID=2992742 RepID=UPI0022364CF5|nr:transporter substrate-binding domain-containing protein [Hoyosella sp. YIM 151337]MCW4352749.1 transporter substrate-binding domain-containing protein [Hoyosella sp. YIM 151337]